MKGSNHVTIHLTLISVCVRKRLWRLATKVRSSSEIDQSSLQRRCKSLQQCGVIYAIYCLDSPKLYVGQTHQSCLERFRQHVYTAYNNDHRPMYRHIRRLGYHRFGIFPLEVLPDSWRDVPQGRKRPCSELSLINENESGSTISEHGRLTVLTWK